MRTRSTLVLFLLAASSGWSAPLRADDVPANTNDRFTHAKNRKFQAFDSQRERSWRHSFFFVQLADTQYGMYSGNQGFEREVALVQQAVAHINRLRPRFVIVCGDLTNAIPEKERYSPQVAQFQKDFSKVDAEIPLVCVCGNHDVGNRPTSASIDSYRRNFGDDYFSFWVGGVCNIVLNSSVLKDPADTPGVLADQQSWLRQQLKDASSAKAQHILLFQHHPFFLKTEDEPDQYFNIPLKRRTPLLAELKQAKVRAVFAGHYHRNSYGKAGELAMITTGPVGRPFGKDRSGIRVVQVHEDNISHTYYGMDDVPAKIDLALERSTP